MNDKLFTPKQLSQLFGVCPQTLISWEKCGKITAVRTQGGHRRYKYDAPDPVPTSKDPNAKTSYVYARVSSAKQKGDLQRQVDALQTIYPNYEVVQDVGSGLNFKRRGLITILDGLFAGRVQKVVVAHRDRLCRFGFDLFQHIFDRFGATLEVLSDSDVKEPINELAQDLLSVVTVFTARYYGARSYIAHKKNQDLPNRKTGRTVQPVPRRIKVLLQQSGEHTQGTRRQRIVKSSKVTTSSATK